MKRFIIPTLLIGSILTAKGTHHPLSSMLLNYDKTIDVNLKHKGSYPYKVKNGDTIASVASRYHITIKKLESSNHLKHKKRLKVGSILQIPDQTIKLSTLLDRIKDAGPMLKEAKEHLGKIYVWGAVGPKTFDCSGFTSYVCRKNGIKIPRTSLRQGEVGIKIARKELKEGDLIFFDTSKEKRGYINHVGIYLGDDKFIHASSASNKVVISSLNQSFYKARFKWGRRVNGEGMSCSYGY
jgi:cell wall-associated NlpC family hydrolase